MHLVSDGAEETLNSLHKVSEIHLLADASRGEARGERRLFGEGQQRPSKGGA